MLLKFWNAPQPRKMTSLRPNNVRRFELLIYLAAATEIVSLASQDIPWNWAIISATAIYASFIVTLIWLTAHRKQNWARWYLFVLFLLGFFAEDSSMLGGYYREHQAAGILDFIVVTLESVAYYLVFTGDSPAWFRRPPSEGPIFF